MTFWAIDSFIEDHKAEGSFCVVLDFSEVVTKGLDEVEKPERQC